jgi:signal transduction histidine kinase
MRWRGCALWRAWLLLFCLLWLPAAPAVSPPAAGAPRVSLEGRLEHFADTSNALSFETVSQPDFVRSHFVRLPQFRSLGYDTHAHWFRIELGPSDSTPRHRVLVIGSPELEQVDVWVQHRDGSFRTYALGYHRPYEGRPITRLPVLQLDTFPGMQVFFRVHTTNAINVYAALMQTDAFVSRAATGNFAQGLYFGILLIAVVLYAILGARLRDAVMAAYAGYVASQLLFHLGATGYLPMLLAGHSAWFMDALPRIGWLGGSIAIVLMWDHLLGLKAAHPNVHRLYLFAVVLNLFMLLFALAPSLVTGATLRIVKLANYLNVLNFAIAMFLLARAWCRNRRVEWMIYLVAFVIPALGALVNTITNQGILPWNAVTANFYQAAALVHVLVMSYGLALRLQQVQRDKTAAEQDAAIATRRAREQRHFVAMLSHEFGNPLAAIDRAAQMMQLDAPAMPPGNKRRLASIRGNAATLSGFVDRFLMTEALDNGALALSRKPCVIRQVLEETLSQQDGAARARIQLRSCPDGAFEMDATLVGVAVGNLLANALRYSPLDSPVEVDAARNAQGLRIRVADHGPGLDADELEQLGRLYFRGAAALGKKGSGLGYHFTRRIVQAHGGTLTARSEAGAGLEVEIFLPAAG